MIKDSKKGALAEMYKGAGIFTISFGLYTVFEFMFYETILAGITNFTRRGNILHQEEEEEIESLNHSKKRNLLHVLFSSFMAGAISATILNPFEYWLARAQNSKGKSVREVILETKNIRSLWKGAQYSILYVFLLLNFNFL